MRLVSFDAGHGPQAGEGLPADDVRLLAPLGDPQKIVCIGLN